ncbi:hypothetical protein NMY22_g1123 [Coprinellus aureogranulatus]|nr:hypothetical protein NMY22_g1123 [Coprinellus aureogranulatus]
MAPGLYYPPDSLKTRFCLRGRDMMYARCKTHSISFRQTGKLVVARREQLPYINGLFKMSQALQVPRPSPEEIEKHPVLDTVLLSGEESRQMEPDLSMDIEGALWVPITGIVDSHSFMASLEKDIIESENGQISYMTRVVRLDPYQRAKRPANIPDLDSGWVVQAATGDAQEGDAILAKTVINAAGLSSTLVLNSLLPQDKRLPMYYAKGSYAKYSGPGVSGVKHLIYPCPETGPNAHAFQSLGTHLTLDLDGKIRFGPDIQWISAPDTLSSDPEEDADFWTKHLVPDENQLPTMHKAITSYLPGVTLEGLQPDYCGMRPKLVPPTGGFQDFVLRVDYPNPDGIVGDEPSPMISLLGIESPGLTSSLGIAEWVGDRMMALQSGVA